MSFTSRDLVRAHLTFANLGEVPIRAIPVVLSGDIPAALPHAGLASGSVIVKAARDLAPALEWRTLDAGWVILNHAQLIPGTVLIAADSSLGRWFSENIDYIVDAPGGRIRRLVDGTIAAGQTVAVWYLHYHLYSEGEDYTVDTTRGELTRRADGAIADGQEVLVDYTVALGAVSDTVIDQAIAESGEMALQIVAPVYHDAPAPGVVVGATHLAVAQLARMRAAAVLADANTGAPAARAAAQLWLEIAAQYDRSARSFLSRYAAPVAGRAPLQRG
jgi:hypothetical protein